MEPLHFKKPKTYKLQGRYQVQNLPISVENMKGRHRYGTDKDGHMWKTHMNYDYGYIRGTNGNDNEAIDVYVGPDKKSIGAYVVHQHKIEDIKNPSKYRVSRGKYICKKCNEESSKCKHSYDEDKVMLGFSSKDEAIKAYNSQYDHPGFLGPVSTYTMDEFKEMLKGEKKKIPYKRLEKAYLGTPGDPHSSHAFLKENLGEMRYTPKPHIKKAIDEIIIRKSANYSSY